MTATEASAGNAISSALDRVVRALHWLDLEMAWIEGLRHCKHPADRDRIMAAAGRRLRVFDEVPDDRLRLTWLSDAASEVLSRGDQPLDDELRALAIAELREALARMSHDIEALRKSAAAGESIRDWARCNVAAANRIRDLGRTARSLNGTGLLALVPSQDAELAIRLADDMASGGRLRQGSCWTTDTPTTRCSSAGTGGSCSTGPDPSRNERTSRHSSCSTSCPRAHGW